MRYVLFLIPVVLFNLAVMAETIESQERNVKVGFIYNFIKLTQPIKPIGEYYAFCVVGKSSLGKSFSQLIPQHVHGKQIKIVPISSLHKLQDCDGLFVGRIAKKKRLLRIIKQAQQSQLLTISDVEPYLKAGVIISLKQLAGKIRFDVNLASAQQSNLVLNANLLRLAHNIIK